MVDPNAHNGAVTRGWTWDDALRGVIPPVISPLDEERRADEEALERVVDHILAGGCSGVFVLGGVGAGAWLNSSQRQGIVRASVRAAAGRAPVLVGVMLPGTAPAREAALQAADAGADALVVGSPYYLALETVEALADEPRVLGVKDSWGDLIYFQSLLDMKRNRPSFRVRAARAGDLLTCNRLNRDVFELTGMYTQKLGLAGLYAACAQLGLARNIPAEPWAAVEGSDSAIIEGLLRKHGLLPTLARA